MGLQATDIQHFLQEGAALPASSVLADAVETYPYAPLVHFLYLRSLQEEDSYKFPAQLHRTAVSTMHRQALLDWAEAPLIPVEVQAAAWQQKQTVEPVEAIETPQEVEVPEPSSAEVGKAIDMPEPRPDSPKSVPSAPEPTPSVSKPATTTKLSEINLEALPPAVRAQVLRSRAIQAQLGKAPVESSPQTSKPIPVPVTEAIPAPDPASKPATPKKIIPVEAEVTPGLDTPAERAVKSAPTTLKKSPPASRSLGNSATEKSKAIKKQTAPTAPRVAAPVLPPTDPSLSPFANFLLTLKNEVSVELVREVPVSQRYPAMERAILEQFLQVNPNIKPVRHAPMGENLALRTPNVSGLVTETLANHYYDQGMHEKAIQAYEILKLKVPEKSAIFAARISEMRKIQSSTK